MNIIMLIIMLVTVGLMIGPAIRHDNELPISVTGRNRK